MKHVFAVLAVLLPLGGLFGQIIPPTVPSSNEGLNQVIEILELNDVTLRDALRLLSEESGLNLVASEEAAMKKISCYLQKISLRHAIETIAKSYGMWYREDENTGVVRVQTAKEFERDIVLFREEKSAVFTLLFPNALDVGLAVRNLFGSRVKFTLDRENLFDEYNEISQRFQRFDLVDRRGQSLGVFGNGGTVATENGTVQTGVSQLSQLGRNDQSALGQQDQLREQQQMDTRRDDESRARLTPDQLQALQEFVEQKTLEGIDPQLLDRLRGNPTSIYVTLLRKNNMIAVRTSDAQALAEIEKLVRRLDVPTPQVLLEVKIMTIELGNDLNSTFDFNFQDDENMLGTNGAAILGGTTGAGGLVYRFVNDDFLARLQTARTENRVTSLATPTLLVSNNEVARLFIGEERPVVRNITSQVTVNQNTVTTTPNTIVETRPVGTTLLITPSINADRTITLRILQENSDIRRGAATIPIITANGNVVDQPVDVVASRSVSGTVVAKDQLTLALGGLVEDRISDQESGVPVLMDIPLLGLLFKHQEEIRSRRELVVMIRPHVLFTAQEGEEITRKLSDDLLHPSASTLGGEMKTFGREDVLVPEKKPDPLKDRLKLLSGKAGEK